MICLPITGYEDAYTISECGLIHSIDRVVVGHDGIKYPFKGKLKSARPNPDTGYPQVLLYKNNVLTTLYVHRLVAEIFIANPENKPEVNHIDGNKLNCHRNNLEWTTKSENCIHAVRTGLKVYTNRLTENEFLECLQAVLDGENYVELCKRVPYKVPFLSTKIRKIAIKYGLEEQLNDALYLQKIARARINGSKNTGTSWGNQFSNSNGV